MLEARAAIQKLRSYPPPLAGRQGLRLDFNENTVGCSPRVLARMRALDAETLARYPDREPVEREVARFLGLDTAQLLLTNGVDEAIHLLCSTYLEAGDEPIIVVPRLAVYSVFVARTFSKAYGLAGLRIGVIVGEATQMEMVRRVASPYNVNAVALAVLPEALRDTAYVAQYAAGVRRNREVLEQELCALGLRYWPSHGNFVLVRIGLLHNTFVTSLRGRGILVRDRNSDPGCEGCGRLTE